MSAIASITNAIPAAPRGAGPSELIARIDGRDEIVTFHHRATPDLALVEILDGDRRGEQVFVPREAFREDTATLPEPSKAPAEFPFFFDDRLMRQD